MSAQPHHPTVGLFVTCLVDAMRPQIGFAAIQLLEEAGCRVEVPPAQTCCGQPALNSGDAADTATLARQTIAAFEGYDHVVLPSGSCAGTMVHGYPELLADDPAWAARAQAMAAKTHEITSFLADVMGFAPRGRHLDATATYHDSCSGLRELGVAAQPRRLLAQVEGLQMRPLEGNDVCCGFGGTFCVKYSDISNAIVGEKAEAIEKTGADLLLAGDLGCLMNMAGKLHRRGARTRCFHTIEVLAGHAGARDPAIGEEG
ncbi:(Fe-S)-binding protein [Pseudorhodoferax sp.]|uniref:(Fe-S)-binding protein n=1 Tax=Pseudorhodoferax sp. TaxID=1993553 RepID=UPI0039E3C585